MSTISSNSGEPVYSWLGGGGTGDEPGVDVKSRRDEEAWGHLTGPTNITVRSLAYGPRVKLMKGAGLYVRSRGQERSGRV